MDVCGGGAIRRGRGLIHLFPYYASFGSKHDFCCIYFVVHTILERILYPDDVFTQYAYGGLRLVPFPVYAQSVQHDSRTACCIVYSLRANHNRVLRF